MFTRCFGFKEDKAFNNPSNSNISSLPTLLKATPSIDAFYTSNETSTISINPFTDTSGDQINFFNEDSNDKIDQTESIPCWYEGLPFAMALPEQPIPGCLPGLEHLTKVDRFYVQHCRETHCIKPLLVYDSRDRYQILNKDGKRMYYAVAESNSWRWGLSGARPFRIKILDYRGKLILTLERPWTLALCWFGGECSGNRVEVRYGDGILLGRIKQRFTLSRPHYDLEDVNMNRLMYASGPPITCCPFFCLRYFTKFTLVLNSPHGEILAGKFVEFPFGIEPQNLSNALSLNFPLNLDVETKAAALGLLFLVYFMYFEVSDVIPGLSAARNASTVRGNRVSDWTNPNRVPFKRLQAGDIPGKCYPCKILFISVIILLITLLILWVTNDFPFSMINYE